MNAKLIVVGGDAKAAEVKLRLPTVIGRGREATLTLPHPLVSRQHCEIYEDGGKLCVRDLGSLNGTFVNNHKIEQATILPSGDLLTIGTVTFRAVYSSEGNELPPLGAPATVKVSHNTVVEKPSQANAVAAMPPPESETPIAEDAFEVPPTATPVATVPATTPAADLNPPVPQVEQVPPEEEQAGLLADDDAVAEVVEELASDEEVVGLDDDEDDDFDFLENELDTVEADEPIEADVPLSETIDVSPPGVDEEVAQTDKPDKPKKDDDDSLNAFFKGLR